MTYQDIINKVKSNMDELTSINGGLLVDDSGEKPIEMAIRETLPGAWRGFALLCPLYLLPIKTITDRSIDNDVASVTKPSDFIRLCSFLAASWTREVTEAYEINTEVYSMQKNPYTRGSATRPIVINKKDVIEGYTVKGNDSVKMEYVPDVIFADGEDGLIPDNISEAFCFHAAGVVYDIFGNKLAEKMYANRDKLCM